MHPVVLLLWGFLRARALAPGDKAPLLQAQDSYGRPVDLRGTWAVLWFYPKAHSPGCTFQAKRYSELYEEFRRLGVQVYGVSHDPASEQCAFLERLALQGGMIPDRDGRLARAYGVRSLFGFYSRDTVLIHPEGRIERVWRGVNPLKDADTVLAYLKGRLR
ncbi:peroxiredoxin [Thermus thermamylovorans]|uniref:thioredoxin-dependent peroxiredoxin n=1 Tax=Thermus thermamylovorans TaxID=2509362 RepID=A0A4Q9B416_9DEIN|nr:peroxiredoxin [Thermus thermamylovorans]TBH20039.1 peroxiredoxin [Thermus thermamylovorans]